MVKICSNTYPEKDNIKYAEHFEKYSFPLSSFQKYAIEAIVEGDHILVTAHTGSGKTLPAEFAIEYFVGKGKKVIYTSPIKALSNQKYHEFGIKYPNISFGILTGDIKSNPEADVLIMTTEILQNTLYRKKQKQINPTLSSANMASLALFDMDIDNELGCVIFDEVHYINDKDRGKVWEETIMMLPLHIQMVMLSATLDAPEKFALWCECRGNRSSDAQQDKSSHKNVYLTTTHERVVPLTHYNYITCTQGIFKAIKDKELEKQIREIVNKPHVIQTAKGEFNEPVYRKIKSMLDLFLQKNIYVKRHHVINQVCKYMVENNMLPAICFVLSRKQLEICAKEVTIPLLEDDSKVPYIVKRECEQIIRKLPNYKEYLELPEYNNMVSLLEKGVAIHHAGIMPVLREMVELLFAMGYVKLLFATETFAVGINMPTKTVVFTDVKKFDGNSGMRMLYSHEYTQMAGRAGRRGIDTIGHVIHLNNLFKNVEYTDYKTMMHGKPQKLVSKFKVSYNLLLNLIDIGDQDFLKFVQRSMIQEDLETEMGAIYYKMSQMQTELDNLEMSIENLRTPKEAVNRYIQCIESRQTAVNKKRKEIDRELQDLLGSHKFIESDKKSLLNYNNKFDELEKMKSELHSTEQYLNENVTTILKLMEKDDFIKKDEESIAFSLTIKGFIATHIREIHCLVFSQILSSNKFDILSSTQLVSVFSCFTNVSVSDDIKTIKPSTNDALVKGILDDVKNMYDYYQDFENYNKVNTGTDYEMHYELINYAKKWCECESAQECKLVLQELESEKGIFLGEFVKAILKINNISSEMERIAESIGNISLLSKLREIPQLTLKFVATNQSLYV
jgi:antiviral helicase SKI2